MTVIDKYRIAVALWLAGSKLTSPPFSVHVFELQRIQALVDLAYLNTSVFLAFFEYPLRYRSVRIQNVECAGVSSRKPAVKSHYRPGGRSLVGLAEPRSVRKVTTTKDKSEFEPCLRRAWTPFFFPVSNPDDLPLGVP